MWETARRAKPGFRAANLCWWYAMGATTDLTVTPRPIYHADGRKSPDCYTFPPQLHDNLTGPLGEFPLFQYWGPTANIKSTAVDRRRGARSCSTTSSSICCSSTCRTSTTTTSGSGPGARRRCRPRASSTRSPATLVDHARARGDQVVVLSEYGITEARRPGRDQPRAAPRGAAERLHAGRDGVPRPVDVDAPSPSPTTRSRTSTSTTRDVAAAREALDRASTASPSCSRAPRSPTPASRTSARASSSPWPSATPGSRTTTGSTTSARPDFGRQVEIHRKPGYDPAELFFDPDDERGAKLRGGSLWRARRSGMRYVLSVVGLDASRHVRGTHGLLPDADDRRAGVPVLGGRRSRGRALPRRRCATCCSTWPG